MNSEDKMEKKKQDGLVKDLIEKHKANGIVVNGHSGSSDQAEDSEDEEERKRKSAAKGKGKAQEQ